MEDKELFKLLKEFQKYHKFKVQELYRQVDYIIVNQIKDTKFIESTFDNMLGFLDDKRLKLLYLKLYKYYLKVNKEFANDYLEFYKEEIKEYKKEL